MQFHRGTENLLLHLSLVYLSQFLCISYFYRFSIEHLGMGINLLMTDKSGRIKKKSEKENILYMHHHPPPALLHIKSFPLRVFYSGKRQNERTATCRKTRILYRMSIYQTSNVLFMLIKKIYNECSNSV